MLNNVPGFKALSSEERKNLRARHPLYARLSGDSVWGLLEEEGLSQEQCGQMLDNVVAEMHHVTEIMHDLEQDDTLFFELTMKPPVCDACKALAGKIIPASFPGWQKFLPPFAIGCFVSCQKIQPADVDALSSSERSQRILGCKGSPRSFALEQEGSRPFPEDPLGAAEKTLVTPPKCALVCPLLIESIKK